MEYQILDDLILRTPKFGHNQFYSDAFWKDDCVNHFFKEPLFLASPDLYYASLKKGVSEESIKLSLLKYYTRGSFRCTPFGLFAGVSTCKWDNDTAIVLMNEIRSTRLDSECAYKIARRVSQINGIADKLRFYPNSTHYTISNKLRYIEYDLNEDIKCYNLSSINLTSPVKQILRFAKTGKTKSELINYLIHKNLSKDDAAFFLNSLIKNQILTSELEPEITGKELLEHVINILKNEEGNDDARQSLQNLQKIKIKLTELDNTSHQALKLYEEIYKSLDQLNISYKRNKVFQVDLFKSTLQNTLSFTIKQRLEIALDVLARLAPPLKRISISNFIKRYEERYGDQMMPLLQVLDTDNGIGYPDLIENDSNSITENIDPKVNTPPAIQINELSRWLYTKVQTTILNNEISLNITSSEIEHFTPNYNKLPDTFSIVFRVIDFNRNKVLIESAGGSTGIKLLGRFAYANKDILRLAENIAYLEQQNNPGKIIAEIIHVPDNRLANILLHPPFYSYEIPFIGRSSLPKENQIELQDLYVYVHNNEVKIVSKKLEKEILPTLSNAHNTMHGGALPVYRFLSDLHSQNKISSLTVSMGDIEDHLIFIPRITYQDSIVLRPATWRLNKNEWFELIDKSKDVLIPLINKFKIKWKLPRYIVLEEYDNELFVDFELFDSVLVLLKTIKNKKTIILKEFLFDENTPIKDVDQNQYANQFVATVAKSQLIHKSGVIKCPNKPKVAVTFLPGSEWLYFKYFCSVKLCDHILIEMILPFINALLKQKLIDAWFFVRFKDSHHHLRIRYHLSDPKKLPNIIDLHAKHFKVKRIKDLVWKIQQDTYEREIKRYGEKTIEYAERLFFHDSTAVLNFLSTLDSENLDNDLRWLWGIKAIDDVLDCFGYDVHGKLILVESNKNAFMIEFDLPKTSLLEIDKKYRKYSYLIASLISGECLTRQQKNVLKIRCFQFSNIYKEMKTCLMDVTRDELVKSYIHMSLNRILQHSHRLQEMVIYDFLYRYYKSKIAREAFVQ